MKKQFIPIDDNQVTEVKDYEMEDGALYSGQMKREEVDGEEILRPHGQGK